MNKQQITVSKQPEFMSKFLAMSVGAILVLLLIVTGVVMKVSKKQDYYATQAWVTDALENFDAGAGNGTLNETQIKTISKTVSEKLDTELANMDLSGDLSEEQLRDIMKFIQGEIAASDFSLSDDYIARLAGAITSSLIDEYKINESSDKMVAYEDKISELTSELTALREALNVTESSILTEEDIMRISVESGITEEKIKQWLTSLSGSSDSALTAKFNTANTYINDIIYNTNYNNDKIAEDIANANKAMNNMAGTVNQNTDAINKNIDSINNALDNIAKETNGNNDAINKNIDDINRALDDIADKTNNNNSAINGDINTINQNIVTNNQQVSQKFETTTRNISTIKNYADNAIYNLGTYSVTANVDRANHKVVFVMGTANNANYSTIDSPTLEDVGEFTAPTEVNSSTSAVTGNQTTKTATKTVTGNETTKEQTSEVKGNQTKQNEYKTITNK